MISLAYSPLVSPLAPKTCDELSTPSDAIKFNTNIAYEAAVPGMILKTVLPNYQPPPGLKFISDKSKSGGEPLGGGGGESKPEGFENNKEAEQPNSIMGFLQRYWYILLPIMIMNLMSEPPQEGQQQQGQGQPQQQGEQGASAPAAATAPAPAGAAPKRRGKRG